MSQAEGTAGAKIVWSVGLYAGSLWDWSIVSEAKGVRGKDRGARSYRALKPGDRPLHFQFKCKGKPL